MPRTKREKSGQVVNLLRPRTTESVQALAEILTDPDATPTAAQLNKGVMTEAQVNAAVDAYNAAVEAGNKRLPSTPLLYQPVVIEAALRAGANIAFAGQPARAAKRPADWDDKVLGEWVAPKGKFGDDDYEPNSAGYRTGSPRKSHISDLRKHVIDPSDNILSIGSFEYVVGNDDADAIFLLNASKSGSYGAICNHGKRLSFADADTGNLVGQFNNKVETINIDDGTHPGGEIVVMPNMFVRWGTIQKGGKTLTPTQIRKAVEAGEKGMKFVPLKDAIVGASFNQSQLWQKVRRAMSLKGTADAEGNTALARFESREARSGERGETRDNVWRNAKVMTRVSPTVAFPFGFRNGLAGIPLRVHFGDNPDAELIRFVIGNGIVTASEYAENKWEARSRLAPEEVEETPEATETPKPKRKRNRKPKAEKAQTEPTEAAGDLGEAAPVEEATAPTEPVAESNDVSDAELAEIAAEETAAAEAAAS